MLPSNSLKLCRPGTGSEEVASHIHDSLSAEEEKYRVGIGIYERPYQSLKEVVERAGGFPKLSHDAKVFIKPNIVFWALGVPFPKWGVLTTSRVIEDIVVLLKEAGISRITIGEGIVSLETDTSKVAREAFEYLGYFKLKKRYGVEPLNIFERPFRKVEIDENIFLNFSEEALESHLIIDVPVLKTHAQTRVSLGIKNLKGLIDINSRKKCHTPQAGKNLEFFIARLPWKLPQVFVVIDGIFSNERGPGFEGQAKRKDILIASSDLLSADKVGATILGYSPEEVVHIKEAALCLGRRSDLSDVKVVGEDVDGLIDPHAYGFEYNDEVPLPLPMEKMGIKGLAYPKYDSTLCTYCSLLNGVVLSAIAKAWKGTPWDDVEVLTGKIMNPSGGKKYTILLGKCMSSLHRHNPLIKNALFVKGCPPKPSSIVEAFHKAGIMIDPSIMENHSTYPVRFMRKYEGKQEFDENFFVL